MVKNKKELSTDKGDLGKLYPTRFSTLGKQICISPKSKVCIYDPITLGFAEETIQIDIFIGKKGRCAKLIMNVSDWEAFKKDAPVTIETLKSFRENLK